MGIGPHAIVRGVFGAAADADGGSSEHRFKGYSALLVHIVAMSLAALNVPDGEAEAVVCL